MATFTRDVLKWLQSLHLSYTYHMPKWDFANGFLIAEIISKSFPQDINIKTFSNGAGLEIKLDNWNRIFKVCEKHQIPITREQGLAVMHGHPTAAVSMVQSLYIHFTKKKIVDLKKSPSLEFNPEFWTLFSYQLHDGSSSDIPHFRLPNTTSLIRAIPDTEFRVSKDKKYIKGRLESILSWQEKALKHFSGSDTAVPPPTDGVVEGEAAPASTNTAAVPASAK